MLIARKKKREIMKRIYFRETHKYGETISEKPKEDFVRICVSRAASPYLTFVLNRV